MTKRIFDIVIALVALVVLSPVAIVLCCLIGWRLGFPIFFTQPRPGLNGKVFTMIKFRSLTDERDSAGTLLPDCNRMTRFGKLLRATSLDELPELFNVLKGDMSVVGPRPLLVEYLPLYTPEQARRHQVRPGITGWAQVNGRNAVAWEERFKMDIWYVDNRSLWLDMKIILLTFERVFRREGISEQGNATMSRFTGSMCKEGPPVDVTATSNGLPPGKAQGIINNE